MTNKTLDEEQRRLYGLIELKVKKFVDTYDKTLNFQNQFDSCNVEICDLLLQSNKRVMEEIAEEIIDEVWFTLQGNPENNDKWIADRLKEMKQSLKNTK